jgi:hypothetical protein
MGDTTRHIDGFRNDPKSYKIGDTVRFKNEDGTSEIGEIIEMIEHLKTGGRGRMVGDQFAEIKRSNGTTCHKFKHEIIKRFTKIDK